MATSIGNDISNLNIQGGSPAEDTTFSDEILVCLPAMVRETREQVVSTVMGALPDASLLIAVTELDKQENISHKNQFVIYDEARSQAGWTLHAADYLAANTIAGKHQKKYVILLAGEMPTATLLKNLAQHVTQGHADIVMPRLNSKPNDGLVNSGVLYPMTRALYGLDLRFPLPQNIALSRRAIERLAMEARREVSAGNNDSLVWPIPVATAAGFSVRQVDTDDQFPSPHVTDFNRLFAEVVGSFLADTEARAIYWQRSRYLAPARPVTLPTVSTTTEAGTDVVSMVEGFRVAYANLLPIWSLVLPPQSLLALKKLAPVSPSAFQLAPELWARIVYDFALAFHLRTINRNHLLGAMTPLYLAWAASHMRSSAGDAAEADRLVEQTAAAFEAEKPYLVSRWRWPDRFNP